MSIVDEDMVGSNIWGEGERKIVKIGFRVRFFGGIKYN